VKQGVGRFAVLVLVIGSIAAIWGPLALGESDREARSPRADPTRLWSAFPLHSRELPRSSNPAAVAETTQARVPDAFGAPHSSHLLLLLFLGIPLGFSVLLLAMAAAPAWALPGLLLNFVYDRRSDLALAGAAIALGVGVGMAVALIGS
jgi:hypothetical protein